MSIDIKWHQSPKTDPWGTPLITGLHLDIIIDHHSLAAIFKPIPYPLNVLQPSKPTCLQFKDKDVVRDCVSWWIPKLTGSLICSLYNLQVSCRDFIIQDLVFQEPIWIMWGDLKWSKWGQNPKRTQPTKWIIWETDKQKQPSSNAVAKHSTEIESTEMQKDQIQRGNKHWFALIPIHSK